MTRRSSNPWGSKLADYYHDWQVRSMDMLSCQAPRERAARASHRTLHERAQFC
jgi:hypothetical protein